MTYSRPSALLLAASVLFGLLSTTGAGVAFASNPAPQCTGWTDEFHAPTQIRVRRSYGPNTGGVDVVPFWNYVGTVEAAEYSTSGPRGPIWLRMGAVAVKEYGWYYAMHWRGGTVTITNEDGSTTTQCFDVRDTTADQIYRPERLTNGVYVPINAPSVAQLQAMSETWSMTLRKWVQTKQKSRFFLTGYRSGKHNPCGSDADGFRIKQKSLGDCITKGLTFEESQRRFYEPNVLIVDPRRHDILDDNDANNLPTYFGDLGLLTPGASGSTNWRVYAGLDEGFAAPLTGNFANVNGSNITGQGVGDVNGDTRKDLVMLLSTGKIATAIATGTGYNDANTQNLPSGAPTDQLLVGDFNGDLLVDVGLLRSTPVAPLPGDPATLVVMRGQANGTFLDPVDWWRSALDLTPGTGQQAQAADVNGDGKADLVIRDATGSTFSVAPSLASCVDLNGYAYTYVGACTNAPGPGLDVAAQWFQNVNWLAATSKWTLTDYNRDGRSDLVVLVNNSGAVDVFGAVAAIGGGTFKDQNKMVTLNSLSVADVTALGVDINPDGLGDLAMVKKSGANTTLQWLRAVQGAASSAVTYTATSAYNDVNVAWSTVKPY